MIFEASRARVSIAGIFLVNGALLGSWAPQVPFAKERLDLTSAELGGALLAMAAGAVVSMPLTGMLVARFGSAPVTRAAILIQLALVPLLALSPTLALFILSLLLFGAANGVCDVAMNSHAVEVEKRLGRPVLSSLHAMFSIGGFLGSAAGGLALAAVSPAVHLIAVAVVALVAVAVSQQGLLPSGIDRGAGGHGFALPDRALVAIGLLVLVVMMVEGAMLDWAAVYLSSERDASPAVAGAGYAAFSFGMAAGRLLGDRIRAAVSAPALVRWGGITAAIVLALAVFGPVESTVLAFAAIGLAVSNLVPILFAAAGHAPGHTPATGVAAAATCGYLGFLAGPPLIGFIAEASSLGTAFLLLAVGCLVIGFFARAARTADPAGAA
ncbi:MFS transporter [Chthonobacter rhizosphaerae]|uniref:MFS transporter n=1 Tax=Chthonobacter rhizosphaerae TaxID=2735553 RepID=UPI0015EE79E6|nr:MFS transporter [Chthonobacter rhizosphaerae]